MARDVNIRPASQEEMSAAHWVRRHREGNKKEPSTDQFELAVAIMSSGMGTVCIEGRNWDDLNSTVQLIRSAAARVGFSIQTVEISEPGAVKYLMRKIQNPDNFVTKDG